MRLFFIICLALCLQNAKAQDFHYSYNSIDATLIENADAVVRLDEMFVEIPAVDQIIVKNKRVVTVLNKKGDKHIHARAWYNEGRKVKNIQAIIYNAEGVEIDKVKEKDFKDVSAVSGGTLYSDSRVKYMEYTPTQYPYTVVFTSEIMSKNTGFVPSWYFIDGYRVSVEKSVFRVTYDGSVGILNKEYNFNEKIINKSKEGDLSYVAENLKAIKYERLSPNSRNFFPRLMVAPKNFNYEGYIGNTGDWRTIGKWMYDELLENRVELSESTKKKVKKMVSGVDDVKEKVKIIYKYVQDNTRYISVQEGIGGIQPIKAIDVDRVKYGDCKGLTNYTKALLQVADINANYTRVYASRNNQQDIDKNFPTFLGQTNHVILNVPIENEEDVWLECTSQIMPFNFLGDFTDDRNVFVITPEGGKIIKTPAYINEDNYKKTEAVYTVNERGDISGDIIITTKGIQYDDRFYLEEKKEEDIIKQYKDYWKGINNLKLNKHEFSNDRDDVVFTEKVKLEATSYGTLSGDRLLFVVNAFNKNTSVPDRYRNRKLPFEIQRGYLDEDEFLVRIPENYTIESFPESKDIETNYGKYSISLELQEGKKSILYKRSLLIKKGMYPKEAYADYRDFRKQVARAENSKIVLVKAK